LCKLLKMIISDNIEEVDDLKFDDQAVSSLRNSPLSKNSTETEDVKEVDIDQLIDPRLLQYAKDQNNLTTKVEDTPMEAKMPLPTFVDVPPTNLLPSDPSESEISALLGVSSCTAPKSVHPRPEQLLEVDNKFDDEPLELGTASGDESYLKVEEVEEVSIVSTCLKTHWGQMIQSRFFLFFIISVPTIVIPCTCLPFVFFGVDHIFIFLFLLFPGMFVYLYFFPESDVTYIDDIFDELDEEESDDIMNEILHSSGIPDYNPEQVYAF